jgi:hypothetical protein
MAKCDIAAKNTARLSCLRTPIRNNFSIYCCCPGVGQIFFMGQHFPMVIVVISAEQMLAWTMLFRRRYDKQANIMSLYISGSSTGSIFGNHHMVS